VLHDRHGVTLRRGGMQRVVKPRAQMFGAAS
jgi:hypothetical protein